MTDRAVFISNRSRQHDYEKAQKFGALRPVTTGNYPIFRTERLTEEIIQALVHSSSEDFLLLSGSSVIAGLCMSVWLLVHPHVNLLLYDRSAGDYVKRKFSRDDVRLDIERERDRQEATT